MFIVTCTYELDYAILINFSPQSCVLSITAIQEILATKIQAVMSYSMMQYVLLTCCLSLLTAVKGESIIVIIDLDIM